MTPKHAPKKAYENDPYELLDRVNRELVLAALQWRVYAGTFELTHRTAIEAAQSFFTAVGYALQTAFFMALARLTDDRKDSVCFRVLVDSMSGRADAAALERLQVAMEGLKHETKPIRRWRDKRLAHNDATVLLGQDVVPGLSRSDVARAFIAVDAVLREVVQVLKPDRVYQPLAVLDPGTPRLFELLEKGLLHERRHDGDQ
jgi:hypothetical protein